ncbi:MAG: hypothetical protein LBF66_01890 [Holosporales bacterium]|jgi:hypothetical protein|nr:hypothetical protein [Holosporales bacterium]
MNKIFTWGLLMSMGLSEASDSATVYDSLAKPQNVPSRSTNRSGVESGIETDQSNWAELLNQFSQKPDNVEIGSFKYWEACYHHARDLADVLERVGDKEGAAAVLAQCPVFLAVLWAAGNNKLNPSSHGVEEAKTAASHLAALGRNALNNPRNRTLGSAIASRMPKS